MLKKSYTVILVFAAAAFVAGCSSSPTSSSGNGTFQINLVDSPGPFSAVNIVVDSVQAHVVTIDSTSEWVTLNSTQKTYNLLGLVNGVNAVMAKAVVPAGGYSQIRLFLGSGSNVVVGSTSYPLTIPSGMRSGLKLNVDATIQSQITYVLTLDFNVNRSIISLGHLAAGNYILDPVIRVITTASNGAISGTVLPAIAKPSITAFGPADTVTTVADSSGNFVVGYLSSGTYTLQVVPSDTTFNDTTLVNKTVYAGSTTKTGTITLSSK